MTGVSFTYNPNSAEIARRGMLSWLGFTEVQFADPDNLSVDAFSVEGWFHPGRVLDSAPTYAYDTVDLDTGSPETHKGSIIVANKLEYAISFDHATLLGFQLGEGNDYDFTEQTVATTGTVTAATKDQTTLTGGDVAGIGIGGGDMLLFNLVDGTYGGFEEIGIVKSAPSGEVVKHSRLAQAPAIGSVVKKVKGWGSGALGRNADSSQTPNAGIEMPIGAVCTRVLQMRRLTFNTKSQVLMIEYFPEVEIVNPTGVNVGDGKTLIQGGFTAKIIAQHVTQSNINGVVFPDAPSLGFKYLLPYAA